MLLVTLFFSFALFHSLNSTIIEYNITVQLAICNPDGYPRTCSAVIDSSYVLGSKTNQRTFPGPLLRGKKGDTIVLNLFNRYESDSTSMHFHGLYMQNNAWMDGVPGVTQPDIAPMTTFTYKFDLTQTGTYWYHSHSGNQYIDGQVGPIIIDYPDGEVDPIGETYNYAAEYTIMMQEWFHERADDLFQNLQGPFNAFTYSSGQRFVPNDPNHATSVLINGRGQFHCTYDSSCVDLFSEQCSMKDECLIQRPPFIGKCDKNAHPLDEFQCKGNAIRLRLIHSGVEQPIRFWIDGHNLTIVSRDAVEVVPIDLDSVVLSVGQRIEVIVNCTRTPIKNHFIFARIEVPEIPGVIASSALLTYPKAIDIAPPQSHPDFQPFLDITTTQFELKLKPLLRKMAPAADRQLVIQYTEPFSARNGEPLSEATINNVTFVNPMFPLTQAAYLGLLPNSTVMFEGVGPNGNLRQTNIIPLELGRVYQLVLVAVDSDMHPWHLHGYGLDCIATGVLRGRDLIFNGTDECGDDQAIGITQGALERISPPLDQKMPILMSGDVFSIQPFAYAVYRVRLDNPGPWLFHCHINWHMNLGLAVILSVEEDGKYMGLIDPPADFPAYLPLSAFKKSY